MSNPHETPPRDLLKRGVALGVPLVVSGSAPGRESRPSPGGRIAMGVIGAAAACVAALSIGGAGGLRAEEARGFRFREASARSLAIDEGERPVLIYNHGTMSKGLGSRRATTARPTSTLSTASTAPC